MEELRGEVRVLTAMELKRAIEEHGEDFADMNHVIGVILEEVNEAEEEMRAVRSFLNSLEYKVRVGSGNLESNLDAMRKCANNLACESIQVAAMCEKALVNMEKKEWNTN